MPENPYSAPEAPLYGGGAAAPAPKPLGLGEIFTGLFTEPSATFQKLRLAPSWVAPTVTVLITALILTIVWATKVDVDAMVRPALEANPKIPADQIDKIIEMQAKFIPVFSPIMVVFFMAVGTFLPALVFFLLGRGKAEAPSYPQALTATAVPNLILIPQQVVVTLLALLRPVGGASPDKLSPTSLGYFLHVDNPKLGALLRHIDPFFIGVYVMTFLALRHVLRLSPAKAWTGTLICVLTTLALRVMGAN
jgi:hypothetical protein